MASASSTGKASWFDRFSDRVEKVVAHPGFFAFCLLIVVTWLVGLPFAGFANQVYHLFLNSPTTAITFLLVALLANTQHRFEQAQNERWCKLFEHLGIEDPVDDDGQKGD